MSGYAESGILTDGVLPPGTAFLEKPFTFSELTDTVKGLLDAWGHANEASVPGRLRATVRR